MNWYKTLTIVWFSIIISICIFFNLVYCVYFNKIPWFTILCLGIYIIFLIIYKRMMKKWNGIKL